MTTLLEERSRLATEPADHYEDFHELFTGDGGRGGAGRYVVESRRLFLQLTVRSHRRLAQNPASGLAHYERFKQRI